MFASRATACGRQFRLASQKTRSVSSSAVTFERSGSPKSVLKSETITINDKLSGSQVLVRMLAAPVTNLDLNSVAGLVPGGKSSGVAGSEGVGEVESVGSGVKGLKKGDRVVPVVSGTGTWSQYAVAEETSLFSIPSSVDVEQAALLGSSPATAIRVLSDVVALKAGDAVVVNGANSGVGMALVQVAKAKGLKVVSVVNQGVSDFKSVSATLKAAGSEVVVDAATAESSTFKKACGGVEPKLAVHCATSAEAAASIARVLAPGGTLVSVSGAGPVTLPSSLLIDRDVKVQGFNLANALNSNGENTFKELLELVKDGALKQVVAAKEPLANVGAALEKASSNPNGTVLFTM